MQDNSGVQFLLQKPSIYNFFQEAVGGNASRRRFIRDHVCPQEGNKIIDVGCGPAEMFSWMPTAIQYVGFDVSSSYIQAAEQRYGGNRGLFLVGTTKTLWNDPRLMGADIVIGTALLHHLDDSEVLNFFEFAYRVLKKNGRLACADPCWIPKQGIVSKWIMSKDRGKNIRTAEGYSTLAEKVFHNAKITIDNKPLRIPSASVYLECVRQ